MKNKLPTQAVAVGYTRVSTVGQIKGVQFTSLDAQQQCIESYAAKNNINLIAIYSDQKSAKDNNRRGLQELISRIKQGDVNFLISYG